MRLTLATLQKIIGGKPTAKQTANMRSVLAGLDSMGDAVGLNTPERLAQYVAQISHESGRFVYDREVWGPTPAQSRYEGRDDLGNTERGDGKKFAGHGPMQITGRANTEAFRDWCHAQGLPAPDFVESPELINTDPWEGIGPIWYWTTRNLNRYADDGNIEMITKKINGGLNGYDDRIALFQRAALVLLGRPLVAGALKAFQTEHGLTPDDVCGPATRDALSDALGKLTDAPSEPAVPVVVVTPAPSPLPVPAEPPLASDRDWTVSELLNVIRDATDELERLTK